jgi:hypothetical protein
MLNVRFCNWNTLATVMQSNQIARHAAINLLTRNVTNNRTKLVTIEKFRFWGTGVVCWKYSNVSASIAAGIFRTNVTRMGEQFCDRSRSRGFESSVCCYAIWKDYHMVKNKSCRKWPNTELVQFAPRILADVIAVLDYVSVFPYSPITQSLY